MQIVLSWILLYDILFTLVCNVWKGGGGDCWYGSPLPKLEGGQGVVAEWETDRMSGKILPIWRKEIVSSICFSGLSTPPAMPILLLSLGASFLLLILYCAIDDWSQARATSYRFMNLPSPLPCSPKSVLYYIYFSRGR